MKNNPKSLSLSPNPQLDGIGKILCESSMDVEEQVSVKEALVHEIRQRLLTVHVEAPAEMPDMNIEDIRKAMLEQLLMEVAKLINDNYETCFREVEGQLHLFLTLFQNR